MTKVTHISVHPEYNPSFSKMVAQAQQDNDGIPRKVVDESLGARLLKSKKFLRDVLGDGPEAA